MQASVRVGNMPKVTKFVGAEVVREPGKSGSRAHKHNPSANMKPQRSEEGLEGAVHTCCLWDGAGGGAGGGPWPVPSV